MHFRLQAGCSEAEVMEQEQGEKTAALQKLHTGLVREPSAHPGRRFPLPNRKVAGDMKSPTERSIFTLFPAVTENPLCFKGDLIESIS
jgi:hypothetical protein